MPFGVGPIELLVVLGIALLIFGPKRLPGAGKALGQGIREFKDSIGGKSDDDEQHELAATAARDVPAEQPAQARSGAVRAERDTVVQD